MDTLPAPRVPDGLRAGVHDRCGLPVWVGQLAPESRRRWFDGGLDHTTLAPRLAPGGDVVLDRMALTLVIVKRGRGDLTLHRCPERPRTCPRCHAPTRVLAQVHESGRVFIRTVEAAVDRTGPLVLEADGTLTWDQARWREGTRFRNHHCPDPGSGRPAPDGPQQAPRRTETAGHPAALGIPGRGGQGPEAASPGLGS